MFFETCLLILDDKLTITLTLKDEINVLMNNSLFTRDEIISWHQDFVTFKGKLDKKTFLEVYKWFYPNGSPQKICDYVFNAFDIGRLCFRRK
jgi:Ca2+-binding EF-hand superfamily protein